MLFSFSEHFGCIIHWPSMKQQPGTTCQNVVKSDVFVSFSEMYWNFISHFVSLINGKDTLAND